MNKQQIKERHAELLALEIDLPKKQIWCSMVDPDLPEGSRFLGVVVVEAQGVAWAMQELNAHKLNLGGEIMFCEIPKDVRIPTEWTYRVMNKQEAEICPMKNGERM
jgi:hypothetical protein